MKRSNTLKPSLQRIIHLADSTIELFSCQGLGFLLCHRIVKPSIPPALAIFNTRCHRLGQLPSCSLEVGQASQPLQRNALPLSHLGVRAQGTFARYQSLYGPEGQESCGSGHSGWPRALQSKALSPIPSWLYISDTYYLCSKKFGLRHNHLASL